MVGTGKPTITAIAAVIAACVLCIFASASAYAFFQASDEAINNFSVFDCSVSIVEDFEVPETVKPGTQIVKDVKFENTGSGSCYVRAYVNFDKASANAWAHIVFNEQDWTESSDGFYYCTSPIAKGELSPSVCSKVVIEETADEDEIESFDVLVSVEAVPAKSPTGNAYESAQEAFAAVSGK